MITQITLAYDGTLGADWVCRYALGYASRSPSQHLKLLTVQEPRINQEEVDRKVEGFTELARTGQIKISHEYLKGKEICDELLKATPKNSLLITSTRNKETDRGLLAGSVSAKLLRQNKVSVAAIRVVQPGLLGHPKDLLWAISGNPRTVAKTLPFLALQPTDIRAFHLLRIMGLPQHQFRHLTPDLMNPLERDGLAQMELAAQAIRGTLPGFSALLDRKVIVSNDWSKEILLRCSRVRTELVVLGASERTLPQKFFYGNPLEEVLRESTCDVAVFRGVDE